MKKTDSRTKKTLINSFMGFLNRFCSIILSFILRTVFIYTLGIQYTGVSSVFTDILTMLSLAELGIGTAIATALYKPLYENDESMIRKLMTFYKHAYRYIALLIIVIGLLLLPVLDHIITNVPDIKENIKIIFILYIIKNASSYLLIYKSTILNADQKQYVVKLIETICMIIRYIVEIITLIVFKSFMVYLVLEVCATIIQNYIVTRRAESEYPYAFKKSKEKLSKEERRSLFKDIKGLAMYQMSGAVGNSIDNVLVSSFIGTGLAGVLSNYYHIRKHIETLMKQFFVAVIPSIGNLAAEGDVNKQYVAFNRVFYLSFLAVNFCSVSMFGLFEPFITLWLGKEYTLGFNVSFVIAFDCFLYILLQAVASFRTANGLFVKGQYRPLITTILNIVLSVILIKYYGIIGTIAATIICRLVTQWYDPYLVFKIVFKKSFFKFYLKYWIYILIFLSGCFIIYKLDGLISVQNTFMDFIIKIILCLSVPNIWALLWTFMTEESRYSRSLIISIIKRKKKKEV